MYFFMNTRNVKKFIFKTLLLLSLFTFGIGEIQVNDDIFYENTTSNIIGYALPESITDARFYVTGAIFFIILYYGITHRLYMITNPILHILAFMHGLISIKYGMIFGEPYIKGWAGVAILYIFSIFTMTTVKVLSKNEILKIVLASLFLVIVFATFSFTLHGIMLDGARYRFQYGNQNQAGVGLCVLLMLYLYLSENTTIKNNLIRWLVTLYTFFLIYLTGSRTAITGVVLYFILAYYSSGIFSGWLAIMIFPGLVYLYFLTGAWEGRDDRLSLWISTYSDPALDLFYGVDYAMKPIYREGFWLTLPYTLGFPGIVMLISLAFSYYWTSIAVYKRYNGINRNYLAAFFIVFAWINLFESVLIGYITQPIITFLLFLAFLQSKGSNELCSSPGYYRYKIS